MLQTLPLGGRSAMLQIFRGKVCNVADLPEGLEGEGLQYNTGPHPVSSLHIYTFDVSRAFMAGAACQAGDADSSRAPDLTSVLQGSVNVHRGALLLVPQ